MWCVGHIIHHTEQKSTFLLSVTGFTSYSYQRERSGGILPVCLVNPAEKRELFMSNARLSTIHNHLTTRKVR